jgi:tetratricopeptide (TPR) repeat protein
MFMSMEASTMLAKSRVYIGLTVSFLLFAGASYAQISAIEGDVKGADGQPVKGAEILIERKDMKGTYKGAKTDKKGHYIYNGLPLGNYKVSLLVEGQVKDSVDGVRTKLGDPSDVSFDLRKVGQAPQGAPGGLGAAPAAEQERGMSKEQKEARDKAKAAQEAAIAKNKALNDAFNAGKEAMLAKNYDAAADAFKKASEVDASQHVIWASLGEAYVNQSAVKTGADQQAALEQGMQAYAKAIELKPDDPGYHNNYALALAKDKKFTESQAELQKAAQIDPTNAAKYYYNLGAVLVNTGQNDAAGEAFKKAIDTDPTYADAQFQYATVLSGKLATAADGKVTAPPGMQEALEKYLALKPDGQYADAAKAMLQMIGATIQTNYENPNAPKKKAPPKK